MVGTTSISPARRASVWCPSSPTPRPATTRRPAPGGALRPRHRRPGHDGRLVHRRPGDRRGDPARACPGRASTCSPPAGPRPATPPASGPTATTPWPTCPAGSYKVGVGDQSGEHISVYSGGVADLDGASTIDIADGLSTPFDAAMDHVNGHHRERRGHRSVLSRRSRSRATASTCSASTAATPASAAAPTPTASSTSTLPPVPTRPRSSTRRVGSSRPGWVGTDIELRLRHRRDGWAGRRGRRSS